MAQASDAQIWYESGQTMTDYEAATDSGDQTVYTTSGTVFSMKSGYEVDIRPNGIVTGTNLVTPNAANDTIDVAAFTMYGAGSLVSVSASTGTLTITRDGALDYIINSVVCTEAGVLSVITGDPHASAFSTVRGDAGGPPSLPLASIEVAQIKTTSKTAAAVLDTEIFQSPEGGTQERHDYPIYEVYPLGHGNQADDLDKINAYFEFAQALPVSHGATATEAATAAKKVYIKFYEPIFSLIGYSDSFVPADETASISSKQIYRRTIASTTTTLTEGSFNAYLEDGISDNLAKLRGEYLSFKFLPDENKTPYSLTQGYMNFALSYPVDDEITAAVTISAREKTVGFDS